MNAEFDVQLGYSLEKGFYFKGSGTFGIEIPLHLILGPLEIKALKLGFDPKDEGLGLDVGTSFELKLGPITAVVENIGLSNLLSFPNGNSNEFSLADIKVAFKPPTVLASTSTLTPSQVEVIFILMQKKEDMQVLLV